MKNENLNIEDLFSSSFDDYRVKPQAATWNKISKKMFARQFVNFLKSNVYFFSAISLAIIGVSMLLINKNERYNTKSIPKIQHISNAKIRPVVQAENMQADELTTSKQKQRNIAKISLPNRQNTKATKISKQKKVETIQTISRSYVAVVKEDMPDAETKIESLTVLPPQPAFEVNTKSGCAPLKITITNNSKYANKYEWSFGNGEFSDETNPVYVYNEPGIYTIKLKAVGVGGVAVSFVDSIVVSNKLIAKTTNSISGQISENEEFSLDAFGQKSTNYKWYFGDGHTSYDKSATHSYANVGSYPISLVARNNENCYDSVFVTKAKVVKSPNKIVFPNAFCPNIYGASSARYVKNTINNDVFYPLVLGTLINYHIKIYAKSGVVLFETRDINIGWNGYYKNKLIPEGVYPYVVMVKFDGDTRVVQKRGNVTVLHKKNR